MKRKAVRHQTGKEGVVPTAKTLMIQQCILGSFQLTRLGFRSGINKLAMGFISLNSSLKRENTYQSFTSHSKEHVSVKGVSGTHPYK